MVSKLRHNRDLVLLHLRQVTPRDLIFGQHIIQQIPGMARFDTVSSRHIRHTLDLSLKIFANLNVAGRQSSTGHRSTISHRHGRVCQTLIDIIHDLLGIKTETFDLRFCRVNAHEPFKAQGCCQTTRSGNSPANRQSDFPRQIRADITNTLPSHLKAVTNTTHPVASLIQAVTHATPQAR